MATERMVPTGFTIPWPEISGAEPTMERKCSGKHYTVTVRADILAWTRRLTVDWLVDAVAFALAVEDAAQAGARQETDATRYDRGLVADDIAEEIASDDDAVETARVLDHDHSRAINQLMAELELGEFLGEDVGHDLAPQTARREHIGLV